MKNDFVTILDFGSSKITCMTASKVSDKGEFVIRAVGQSAYNGFSDSGWYEPNTIDGAVSQAISQVENKMKCRIKDVFVGVPGAFCKRLDYRSSGKEYSFNYLYQQNRQNT